MMKAEAPPDHDGPPTEGHPLLQCVVLIPLALRPPHSVPPVGMMQVEPGLVAEQDLGPYLACPPDMLATPGQTSPAMCSCQPVTDSMTATPQLCFMQAVADCSVADVGVCG